MVGPPNACYSRSPHSSKTSSGLVGGYSMQISARRVQDGMHRLLSAPRDLKRWDAHIGDPSPQSASPEHLLLFDAYKSQLRVTAKRAEETWDSETAWRAKQHGNAVEAHREQWIEFPAGPAAQPDFIALVRRTWLACDALNKIVPAYQAVAPEVLLLKWPAEEFPLDHVVIKVLCCMPYWPLGLDKADNWC